MKRVPLSHASSANGQYIRRAVKQQWRDCGAQCVHFLRGTLASLHDSVSCLHEQGLLQSFLWVFHGVLG
eukprot:2409620-Amphidinium_carterae.1